MASVHGRPGEYTLNEYFVKKLENNSFLITTRHGAWMVLSSEEYDLLRHNSFKDTKLFSLFEEKGIIFTNRNVSKIVKTLKAQYSFLDFPTMLCVVTLTNRCTLQCVYCHANTTVADSDNPDMDKETMHNVIDFICGLPHKSIGIEFQGGEPLLRFDMIAEFLDVLEEKLKKCGKLLTSRVIVTNLTLLNKAIADELISKNIGLCTSLDGPKELHDRQRMYVDGRGSYSDVVEKHKYLKRRGRVVNVLTTITAESIKVGAKAIIDEYLHLGLDRVNFRSVHRIGRGKNAKFVLDDNDFFEFWRGGIEYLVELNLKGVNIIDYPVSCMLKNILTPVRSYMCMRRPCGAGISQIAFNTDGTILPCDLARSIPELKVGNVKDSSYSDVVFNLLDVTTRISETQPLCDSCVFSPYCGTCLCRTYSAFGDIVPKTPQDFDCKVNRKMFTYLFQKLCDDRYRKIFEKWVNAI